MSDLFEKALGIDLEAVRPYLQTRGWHLEAPGQLGDRWQLRLDDAIRNVAVPGRRLDDHDRASMLVTLLRALADVEHRDPEVVARDIADANADILEFRLAGAELSDGEMPLRSARELTGGAFDAVQSAARAEVARRAYYQPGTLPAQVRAFVDAAKLAGTAHGSVILQVRAPAQIEPAQETFLPPEPSFERRVVHRLVEGVRAAKAAAHLDLADLGPLGLDDAVEEGLSANLCQALLNLSGEETQLRGRVELRVRWALTYPAEAVETVVDVNRGELDRLPEVASILKEVRPEPGRTVQGPVTELRRPADERSGWVTIRAEVDYKVKTVRMFLAEEDYAEAIRAHEREAEAELRATGTLEHAGRSRELTDATNIEIVPRNGA